MGGSAKRLVLVVAVLGGLGLLFLTVLGRATLPRADLVIANGPDPRSLDPAVTSAIADARLLSSLFEGLLAPDPETLEPIPAVASAAPEVSPDGLTWTFRVREGLRWSDGHPLDARDLQWSYLRFLDPETAAASTSLLYGVRGARAFNAGRGSREDVAIRAPDPHTIVFGLERPMPQLAAILTLWPLSPCPRHVIERYGDDWTAPEHFVCNGPFRPVLWRLRDRVRVVKNPYFREAEQVALDTVDFLCVEQAATQLNLYVNDDADVITEVPTPAVPALLQRFGPETTGEFVPGLRLGTFYFRVNTTRKPFGNKKVRRALSLAVDRKAIVENVTRAGELPARSFVPPGMRCGAAAYEPPLICHYDLDAAKSLLREGLAEEGLGPDQLPLFEVLYSPDVNDQAIAEVLQKQWEALGVRCRLVNMESTSVRSAVRRLDYTIGRSSWIGDFNDPVNFLDLFISGSSGNQTGFSDARYDRIVAEETARASDARRAALFAEAEEILLEEAPVIPVYHYVSRSMVKPWVEGWHRNVLDWHPPRYLRVSGRRPG